MHSSQTAYAADRSSLFRRAGIDRILLRSVEQEERLEDVAEALCIRRQQGVEAAAIDRARTLLRKYLSPLPAPLLTVPEIDTFVCSILGRTKHHPLSLYFLDTTIMRQGEFRTGSFKDYAPVELYDRVERGDIPREAHTVSTGNHAFALANAVYRVNVVNGLNIKAVATMDVGACEHKKDNVRSKGGIIREYHTRCTEMKGPIGSLINSLYAYLVRFRLVPRRSIRSYKEGEDLVNAEAHSDAGVMRLPHDNVFTACGYAVMALEAREQLPLDPTKMKEGELAAIVPLGSGGLMHGWLEFKVGTKARVFGASTPPATSVFDSLRAAKALRIEVPSDPTFKSDGILATTETSAMRAIRALGDGALLVRDEDAFMATALLACYGIKVEPTSGLPLASVMLHADLFREAKHIVMPLSSRHVHAEHQKEMEPFVKNPELIHAYFEERRQEIDKALMEFAEMQKEFRVHPLGVMQSAL